MNKIRILEPPRKGKDPTSAVFPFRVIPPAPEPEPPEESPLDLDQMFRDLEVDHAPA